MIIKKKDKHKTKSMLSSITIIEHLILLLWFTMPYFLYIMFDWFDIITRVGLTIGIFIVASILVYWFGNYMGSEERYWN